MAERGPVVVDWPNAARGDGLTDVGLTYVLLTCPEMPAPRAVQLAAQPVRLLLARMFASRYRGPDLDARIAVGRGHEGAGPELRPRRGGELPAAGGQDAPPDCPLTRRVGRAVAPTTVCNTPNFQGYPVLFVSA